MDDRQTERTETTKTGQTDRQTDRQIDRQARERERQTRQTTNRTDRKIDEIDTIRLMDKIYTIDKRTKDR